MNDEPDRHDHDEEQEERERDERAFHRHVLDLLESIKTNSSDSEAQLSNIAFSLAEIANFLRPKKADKLALRYTVQGGTIMGAPVSMAVGNTASPSVVETAAGAPVAPIGPLVFASDNSSVVSVDPNTGVATGVSAGSANVSVVDQGNGLSDSVAFSVSGGAPPPADTLSLSYSINATRRR